MNPDYYRSSGVTIAIKRIHQAVSDSGIENYFVDCGCRDTLQDDSWMPVGRLLTFKLMSLNPLRLLLELFQFFSWVKSNKIKVIHVHHRRLLIILNLFKPFYDSELLYSANLTYKFNFLFWMFSPKNIIAITKSVEVNVTKTTRSAHIEVIGNPTEFPAIYPNNKLLADSKKAICVARFDSVKGHRHLIDAWYLLAQKGFRYQLLLVGEGVLLEKLRVRVKELKLGSLVVFYGYTSDVCSLYEQSLFSILVSEIEGQGIVTIEAASVGRASLLTDVDGSRDCLPPNRLLPNGVAFGDAVGLSNTIEYWFTHPLDVMNEGQIFFQFHKNINSFDAIGEKYTNAYRRLFE